MSNTQAALNFIGGNGLNGHSSHNSDQTNELVERMRKEVNTAGYNQPITVDITALYNRKIDPNLGLPNDVILVSVIDGDYKSIIPLHLNATAVADIGVRTVTISGHGQTPMTTTIPKFPSEVHCDAFEKIIREATKHDGIDMGCVAISQSVVLYQDLANFSNGDVSTIVGRAIMRSFTSLKVDLTKDFAEVSVKEINAIQHANLQVNVTFEEAGKFDEMGVASAAGVTMALTTNDGNQNVNGKPNDGLIRPSSTSEIGRTRIRSSVVASNGAVMHKKNPSDNAFDPGNSVGASYLHSFTPQVIIEEVGMGDHDSFGKYILMLAHSALVMNGDMIPKMYSKPMLAGLNYRCNLRNSDTPEALPQEYCIESYGEVFKAMFTDTAILSMIVRPGSWDYEYSKWFLLAAQGDQKAMAFINRKINEMMGTDDTTFDTNSLVQPMFEEYPVGIYTQMLANQPESSGEVRPLSEIDLSWLNTFLPGNEDVVNKWVISQSTALPDEGLALKEHVLSEATNHTYRIMDRRFLLTFTPRALDLFSHIRNSITLVKYDNFSNYQQVQSSLWSGHIHAGGGVSYAAGGVGSFGTTTPYQGQSQYGYNGGGYNGGYRS